ncbi:acyl-CoA dehydrogenase [Parazoarcus communis]|uniref:Acyl-CoA dehydrogenase n=1 Tax=Parazoarcus communis TaxID=41977 RepID=A0A2U8GKX2_9RHOO|nr:acyl-CoA dehydrogenase [Parazoarcus communis]AWI74219.1 acyl-CoA dehydrogenase [Parazoarcus communis]
MREIFDSTLERLFSDLVTVDVVLAAEGGNWPTELWQNIEESGFTMALVPEELGGAGASWADVCGIIRLCGRFNLPVPLPEAMLANWLLGASGLEGVAGTLSFASAGDLRIENGVVSGSVTGVPWGREVSRIVAIAQGEVPTVVLLSVEAAGLEPSANTAGEARDTFVFASVKPLAAAALPTAVGTRVLETGGAMLRAAQIAGALEATLNLTSTYAGERVQFGKAIGSFQAIQHQIAVLSEHAAASVMAAEAAFAESGDTFAVLQVMAAKICASEAAGIAASVAHGVHGAIGFTHEHALHLTTRRLWSWRSEYGSLTYWSQQLGRAICAGGSGSLWPAITCGALAEAKEVTV